MLERLLIAGILVAIGLLAIAAGRRWYDWRNARIEARLRASSDPGPGHAGTPRIVYFTTRTCVVCKAQQEPAIRALQEHVRHLRVERHDAVEDRELADEYGVLTVPTTAVYDASGQLVTVNRGFAPASLLLSQLRGDEPMFEGGTAMSSEPLA